MDKRLRDQLRAVKAEGFTVLRVATQGNNHCRAYVNTPVGERFIPLGCSPRQGAAGGAFVVRSLCRKMKRSTGMAP